MKTNVVCLVSLLALSSVQLSWGSPTEEKKTNTWASWWIDPRDMIDRHGPISDPAPVTSSQKGASTSMAREQVTVTNSPADRDANEAIRRMRNGDRGTQPTIVHSQAVGQKEVLEYEQRKAERAKARDTRAAQCERKIRNYLQNQEELREVVEENRNTIRNRLSGFDFERAHGLEVSMAWSEYNAQVADAVCSTELLADTVERYQSTWQFPWRNSGAYAMAGDALRVSMDELAEGSMHATVDQRVSQDGLDASFLSREIAIGLLDVMTGYAPVVSTARDAYEAISGYDLISGEELDVGARSLAVLGVATLGMGKGIKAAIKTIEKVGDAVHAANQGVRIAHGLEGAIRGAGKIADSAVAFKQTPEVSKLFTTPEKALGHYAKHERSLRTELAKETYSFGEFMSDANHVIKEGTFSREINGYVKIIGGPGKEAKAAVVGLTTDRTAITTFHIDYVKNLAKDAPSLGWSK